MSFLPIWLAMYALSALFKDSKKKSSRKSRRSWDESRRKRREYERRQREHLYWCEQHGQL